MKKNIVELLIFLGVIGGVFLGLTAITYSPCDTPLSYHIQTVDARFNLSASDFTKDAQQAAQIWKQIDSPNAPDAQALVMRLS